MSDSQDYNPYQINERTSDPVEEKVAIDPSELYGGGASDERGQKMSPTAILFDPSGRLSRWTFFKYSLLSGLGWWLLVLAIGANLGVFGSVLAVVSFIVLFYVHVAMLVKRWHDMNQAGTSAVMNFIPILNIYATIKVYLSKGTEGSNDYGLEEKRGWLVPDLDAKSKLDFIAKL